MVAEIQPKSLSTDREVVARIPVPDGVCYYVRMLYYDRDGLRVLVTHLSRTDGCTREKCRETVERYVEVNREYMMAFHEMCAEYASEYLGGMYELELSFLTEEIVVWRRAE